MRRNNKKKLITSLVVLLILSIGIVYAYLTSNLSITGATEIAANTWDIHFENIQITEGSVAIETGGSAAAVNPSDDTEVTYSVKLNKPGDFYEFTVDVKNDGTLDGMIESISSTLSINNATPIEILSDNSNLPAYLNYSVTYSDDIAIEPNHELKAGNKETYKVRVEFKKDITSEQLPQTNSVHLSFGLRPIMVQANESAVEVDRTYIGYKVSEFIRNSAELAMIDWPLVTGIENDRRPLYIKCKINNNNVVESYVEFIITPEVALEENMIEGTYTLTASTSESVQEENIAVIKEAFDYENYPERCDYFDGGFGCAIYGAMGWLSSNTHTNGTVNASYGDPDCFAFVDGEMNYCTYD